MRGSLETAQGRLHFMQGELSIRERECQQLKEKLEEQQRCENDLKVDQDRCLLQSITTLPFANPMAISLLEDGDTWEL